MIKTLAFSAALALISVTAASAAVSPQPLNKGDSTITPMAEECGPGWWRGPNGYCHPFTGPGGSLRGTRFACPPGMHIGPYGHRCWF